MQLCVFGVVWFGVEVLALKINKTRYSIENSF